jgi:hypothetical protein
MESEENQTAKAGMPKIPLKPQKFQLKHKLEACFVSDSTKSLPNLAAFWMQRYLNQNTLYARPAQSWPHN